MIIIHDRLWVGSFFPWQLLRLPITGRDASLRPRSMGASVQAAECCVFKGPKNKCIINCQRQSVEQSGGGQFQFLYIPCKKCKKNHQSSGWVGIVRQPACRTYPPPPPLHCFFASLQQKLSHGPEELRSTRKWRRRRKAFRDITCRDIFARNSSLWLAMKMNFPTATAEEEEQHPSQKCIRTRFSRPCSAMKCWWSGEADKRAMFVFIYTSSITFLCCIRMVATA